MDTMDTIKSAIALVVIMVVGLAMGCSDEVPGEAGTFNTEEELDSRATLNINPEVVEFPPGVTGGEEETREVVVENEGPGSIELLSMAFTEESDPWFRGGEGWLDAGSQVVLEEGEEHRVEVVYEPEEASHHEGMWVVETNSRRAERVDVEVFSDDVYRTIFVQPTFVHFPDTVVGGVQEREIQVRNLGTDALTLEDVRVETGQEYFEIAEEGWDSPVTIEGEGRETIPVVFEPDHENEEMGSLVLESDDPNSPEVVVELSGNGVEPCLEVISGDVDFGGSTVGQRSREIVSLRNCSPVADVVVESAMLGELTPSGSFEEGSGPFEVDEDSLDGALDGGELLELEPGEMDYFWVEYEPASAGEDETMLRLKSNDPGSPVYLDVMGEGIDDPCPEAVISAEIDGETVEVDELLEVNPLDEVIFDAGSSSDPNEEDLSYHWSLVQRPMTSMVDVEEADQAIQELVFSTTGQYRLELQAENESGVEACSPDSVTVVAAPDNEIHVELSWHMPLTADGQGGDLDLHYRHSKGDWAQFPYGVSWQNVGPDWGDGSEVGLANDDRYGAMPETVVHDSPEAGHHYSVGAHYFTASGPGGPAQAVVEIYFDGELVFSDQRVLYEGGGGFMEDSGDFWHVADIVVEAPGAFWVDPVDDFMEDEGIPGL